MKRIASKIIAAACSGALCLSLAPAAMAANTTASTDVMLTVSDNQISFTAPSTLTFTIDAGSGSIIAPDNFTIENTSVVPITVKSYEATCQSGFNGVAEADYEAAEGNNTAYVLAGSRGEDEKDLFVSQSSLTNAWNMTASDGVSGSGTDSCTVQFEGEMKNITSDYSTPVKVATIVWTCSTKLNV